MFDLLFKLGADVNAVNKHNETGQFISLESHSIDRLALKKNSGLLSRYQNYSKLKAACHRCL